MLCLTPLILGAGTTIDLGQFRDSQPVPPEMPPLLEKLLGLRHSLIEGPEPAFPAPPGYRLPWLADVSHTVAQAPDEGPTHRSLHAWDFDLKYELVLAARGGRVSMVRASERVGGCDSVYRGRANYILIDHGDGTSALYLHIDYQGALVQEGALVAQGRAIAYSGSSGLSCGGNGWAGPHLHFQVQRTVPGQWWSKTIPIVFDELEGDALVRGKSYVSANLPSNLVSSSLAIWFLRRPARGAEILVLPSHSFLSRLSDIASAPTPASTPTATATGTPTPAPTATATSTSTPRPTATATATGTPTPAPTTAPTSTSTPPPTATATPTSTPEPAPTAAPAPVSPPRPIATAAATGTPTPVPAVTPTSTSTPPATATAAATGTPTPAPTVAPTSTSTPTS